VAEYKTESLLSLGAIPADSEEGRNALTRAIDKWVYGSLTAQWPRALQAFENAAYLMGNHVARFYYDSSNGFGLSSGGNFVPGMPGGDADTVPKTTDNRLPRAVEAMTGLLTETEPSPRVTPNSDSPEDEDAAALSEILLRLVYERPLNMPELLREACSIGALFDGVIAETDYAETGERVTVPVMGSVSQIDAITGEEVDVPVQTGEVTESRKDADVQMWTPLHITVDPGATNTKNITWVARTTFEDVDSIYSRFVQDSKSGRTEKNGYFLEKGDTVAQTSGANNPLYWYVRIQDLMASPQNTYGGGLVSNLLNAAGALPNQTQFTIIEVRPSDQFPQGRTLIMAGGKLIYAGKARAWSPEYPWRWHPYSFWSWFKIAGKFLGMSMLSEIVPLQKRINAIDNLLQKNREYMAIGQWFLPKHSKVKLSMIGGMPGSQYEYTDVQGLSKPERVQNQPLPADLYAERESLVQAIEYISGTGTLDDQIAQSAARAGVVLDFLRNEKLRNKSPMLRSFEQFVENISQNVLIDLQLNLKAEDPTLTNRIRQAAREHSLLSIQAFTGASLRDHHAVEIDISSELRHSPEAAEQRATEFFQFAQGQVSPAERAGILDAMRLTKYVKSEQDASLQRARRMIARIQAGMVDALLPMPNIDDPTVMAPEFQRAILADRFMDFPQEIQQALLQGFDYYAEAAAQVAQAQMMQELMMTGQHPSQLVAAGRPPEVGPPPASGGGKAE
jgi:hypothetical protein